MSGGEDEAVAGEPFGLVGVVAERRAEEGGPDFGAAEGEPEVAGGTFLDGVDGEAAGFIGGAREVFEIHGANWVVDR